MSDRIPFELQEDIVKRLPVISLIQFRSVSKAWKALIDSSAFIASHTLRQNPPQRLLLRYTDPITTRKNYVSFIDDDTFPQNKFAPTVPEFIDLLRNSKVIGASHGLLCCYGYLGDESKTHMAVVWNPSIRKYIAIDVPDIQYVDVQYDFGFLVCPVTNDATIIKITQEYKKPMNLPWKVEVYTLSSGKWRSLSSNCNLPRNSVNVSMNQVVVDGLIYWGACDRVDEDDRRSFCNLLISFDMSSEKFGAVNLPDVLAHRHGQTLCVLELQESLAVFEYHIFSEKLCDVWMMMGDGVEKSFTKLLTVRAQHPKYVVGFRKSGEPIMAIETDDKDPLESEVAVYEPDSEHIYGLGIYGQRYSFWVTSYSETLFLLGRANCSSY